jgi:hypothetical protein
LKKIEKDGFMSHEKNQIPIERIRIFVELLELASIEMRSALKDLEDAKLQEFPHGAWKTLHTGMEHLFEQGRKFVGPLSPMVMKSVDEMLLPEQLEEKRTLEAMYREKRSSKTKSAIAKQIAEAAKVAKESPSRKSRRKSD